MRISDWSSDVCSSDLFKASPFTLAAQRFCHFSQFEPALFSSILVRARFLHRLAERGKPFWLLDIKVRIAERLLIPHDLRFQFFDEIGRASCRARVCQYG